MAGRPEDKPMVREERRRRAAVRGEPLYDRERSLIGVGNSVGVTIPKSACDILDFELGDSADVEVYDDGIWIDGGGGDD